MVIMTLPPPKNKILLATLLGKIFICCFGDGK
jgi:hypothetical protein